MAHLFISEEMSLFDCQGLVILPSSFLALLIFLTCKAVLEHPTPNVQILETVTLLRFFYINWYNEY